MIQELKFKNFLSFRDEAIFSFEPTKDEPINRVATMADGTKLLRFAVVFGANASGKSNFLEVLDFLRRFWTQVPRRNDLSTRVIPFLLDKNTPSEDSVFEMKFYVGDVRDPQSMRDVMPGVDYIFHAAALKQVPSCEFLLARICRGAVYRQVQSSCREA